MRRDGHHYRNGVRGRSLTTRPGVGGVSMVAHLTCSGCGLIGDRNLVQLMPPEQIDKKFAQAGWSIDQRRCPGCIQTSKQEKAVATKPSQAAMKAQTQMFRLLSDHFDTDAGAYDLDWNDQRIATATGLALDVVTEFRRAGFGEIKEPPAIAALRADLNSLESLSREHQATVTAEIASMRARLAAITTGSPR